MSFPYFIKLQIDKLPKSLKWSIVFIQYLQIGLLINGWLSWGVKLLRGNFKNENGVFSPSTISLRTVNQMKFKRLIHDFFSPLFHTPMQPTKYDFFKVDFNISWSPVSLLFCLKKKKKVCAEFKLVK